MPRAFNLYPVRYLGGNFNRFPRPGMHGLLQIADRGEAVLFDMFKQGCIVMYDRMHKIYSNGRVLKRGGLFYVAGETFKGTTHEAFFAIPTDEEALGIVLPRGLFLWDDSPEHSEWG